LVDRKKRKKEKKKEKGGKGAAMLPDAPAAAMFSHYPKGVVEIGEEK